MREYGVSLPITDLKVLNTVLSRCFRVIECLMLSCGRLLAKIIGTKIVETPGSGSRPLVTSQYLGQSPGQIGDIDAMHQPVGPLMVRV